MARGFPQKCVEQVDLTWLLSWSSCVWKLEVCPFVYSFCGKCLLIRPGWLISQERERTSREVKWIVRVSCDTLLWEEAWCLSLVFHPMHMVRNSGIAHRRRRKASCSRIPVDATWYRSNSRGQLTATYMIGAWGSQPYLDGSCHFSTIQPHLQPTTRTSTSHLSFRLCKWGLARHFFLTTYERRGFSAWSFRSVKSNC